MRNIITPLANRGLNSQNVHPVTNSSDNRFQVGIDWLQGTVPISTDEEVIAIGDFLQAACKDVLVWSPGTRCKHGKVWENEARGGAGVLIAWTLPERPDEPGSLWFSLSAKVCQRIGGTMQQCKFIQLMQSDYGAKFTRIDIAIDDFHKELKLSAIVDTLREGNFSGFQRWNFFENSSKGWTINLGSRQSESIVRIYDKSVETNGEIDSIRWEKEVKSLKADELAKQISNLDFSKGEDVLSAELARFALGGINFIIKSDKNVNRCQIVNWFSEFLSAFLEPIKLVVERIKPTLERSINWLKKSVAATLAVICQVKNESFIHELIDLGKERLSSKHYALMSLDKIESQFV